MATEELDAQEKRLIKPMKEAEPLLPTTFTKRSRSPLVDGHDIMMVFADGETEDEIPGWLRPQKMDKNR